ncbi:sugar ABC transporter substrate-binding protein [Luteipulveratus sp. YIM 133132]|uniref:ABC transporter substrate-binding protein n=1 Tax=Luteipulveratus flavus TaxID=3031728 RepID=UPI0023B05CA9|nr:sugar ABC transporter substrate-binding protein [Luteipulveratus sp. YIM 133132]MDE9364788.1 sugar ABC transporter substrate-binding protein [Luteipulveratus sp. YIM 133132]
MSVDPFRPHSRPGAASASPPSQRPTRRTVLAGALGALATPALTGCAGLTERVSANAGKRRDRLSVQVYGTDVEVAFYDRLARRFEQSRRGVTVDLVSVPFSEASVGIDAALASGTAPDVFRVDYPTMGVYASADQLLDVGDALSDLRTDISPAFLEAVSHGGRIYGMPQHIDTSGVVYRPDVLRDAGITSVPDRPQDAWSWEEFAQVAQRLTDKAPDGRSAFAVNWQALGAFRWLNWLFQAGGHLYNADQSAATLDTAAARRALDFTSSFFRRGWVPDSTSTKGATLPDAQFTSGTLAMVLAGNFLLPAFSETIGKRFGYAVTYLPQDHRAAGELGGNALVATRGAANPELASDFLAFLGAPAQMRDFCQASVLLPTRSSLLAQRLDFAVADDLMPVYAQQVRTIGERDVADVTTATFAEVNLALANELEQCFLGGRSTGATLSALADAVDQPAGLNDEGGRA